MNSRQMNNKLQYGIELNHVKVILQKLSGPQKFTHLTLRTTALLYTNILAKVITVKVGYNNLDYYEDWVITNNIFSPI